MLPSGPAVIGSGSDDPMSWNSVIVIAEAAGACTTTIDAARNNAAKIFSLFRADGATTSTILRRDRCAPVSPSTQITPNLMVASRPAGVWFFRGSASGPGALQEPVEPRVLSETPSTRRGHGDDLKAAVASTREREIGAGIGVGAAERSGVDALSRSGGSDAARVRGERRCRDEPRRPAGYDGSGDRSVCPGASRSAPAVPPRLGMPPPPSR